FALNHVHCYLLDDGDGWTIIDAGLNTNHGRVGWQEAFDTLHIAPADLKRIILTHTHPDHYGLAGWLQRWGQAGRPDADAPLVFMSPRETAMADAIWGNLDEQIRQMSRHLVYCGLDYEMADDVANNTRFVGTRTRPQPHTTAVLNPGDKITMGQRTFEILSYAGHSDGQLLFYCAEERLLLSGDHVLMDITPNISRWPGGWDNPLGRYLDSLAVLKGVDVGLALPGHKRLITDWHGRLTELEKHHAERLGHTVTAVENGDRTVADIAKTVFRLDHLTVHEARFAITETLAHLDYLVANNTLTVSGDDVWLYHIL
ncbi:MAG: MBL fold metallo-hydrolase, partial [Anaerolineales bacterium]|nr:MBL fold metallo-hydrolase [Anaerolineales bacterium]